MSMRDEVVREARSWLGTPYHHQAAIKGVGVDCAMLLVAVFCAVGLVPADLDPRPYSPDWHINRGGEEIFLGWLERCGERVDVPRPGDVGVWKYGRCYSHGAIVTSVDGELVHALMGTGLVVLGNLRETELAQRQAIFWRVHGIDGEG